MINKIRCFFGYHDWKIIWQEREPANDNLMHKDKINVQVECKHCPKKEIMFKYLK